MEIWRKIDRAFAWFLQAMAWIAAAAVFVIMLLITADVMSRLLFNKPFAGTAEIVSSIIIVVCFMEIPHVAAKGAHVRNTWKCVTDILAALIGVIVYACIIRASWANFINAIKIGEAEIAGSLRITTVPGRFIIIFGSLLIILEFINEICKLIYKLRTGRDLAEKGEAA